MDEAAPNSAAYSQEREDALAVCLFDVVRAFAVMAAPEGSPPIVHGREVLFACIETAASYTYATDDPIDPADVAELFRRCTTAAREDDPDGSLFRKALNDGVVVSTSEEVEG